MCTGARTKGVSTQLCRRWKAERDFLSVFCLFFLLVLEKMLDFPGRLYYTITRSDLQTDMINRIIVLC